ncbi:hypothetical protein FGO68_gene3060 [Halteria grandinella]|uniref:Uncharacterized protein n=1 Tax=Halteria grandinella TaxID=5974 RepID=A0A8J8P165_HALGN|nr:hypothetical protein FGO68_gene3060 [Halteria grandinella]
MVIARVATVIVNCLFALIQKREYWFNAITLITIQLLGTIQVVPFKWQIAVIDAIKCLVRAICNARVAFVKLRFVSLVTGLFLTASDALKYNVSKIMFAPQTSAQMEGACPWQTVTRHHLLFLVIKSSMGARNPLRIDASTYSAKLTLNACRCQFALGKNAKSRSLRKIVKRRRRVLSSSQFYAVWAFVYCHWHHIISVSIGAEKEDQ